MKITTSNQLLELKENKFVGELPKLTNSQINFNGKNNILICESGVHLWNSRIDFNFNNSILYLSSNNHDYYVRISLHNNNVCYIGNDNYFNGLTSIILSEAKNVVIGRDCLFSYNITVRVADGHLIYDSKSKKRMNYSKSIYIGDHVWLGQNLMIFKGTKIGSGSIIGANSVLSNKLIPSNTTFAGNHAKLIHENSFWTGHSVHGWVDEQTQKMKEYSSNMFIYEKDNDTIEFDEIEYEFNNSSSLQNILKYIEFNLLNTNKNRFALTK